MRSGIEDEMYWENIDTKQLALTLGAELNRMEDINRDCIPKTIDQMTNNDESVKAAFKLLYWSLMIKSHSAYEACWCRCWRILNCFHHHFVIAKTKIMSQLSSQKQ